MISTLDINPNYVLIIAMISTYIIDTPSNSCYIEKDGIPIPRFSLVPDYDPQNKLSIQDGCAHEDGGSFQFINDLLDIVLVCSS